jgi:hypothetical protein
MWLWVVMAFASDKYFGLIDMGQRGLEWNTSECRDREASSIIIPTVVLFSLSLVSLFNRPSRVSTLSLVFTCRWEQGQFLKCCRHFFAPGNGQWTGNTLNHSFMLYILMYLSVFCVCAIINKIIPVWNCDEGRWFWQHIVSLLWESKETKRNFMSGKFEVAKLPNFKMW